MLSNLIPEPYRVAALLIGLALAALAGAAGGAAMAARYFEPKLAEAQGALGEYRNAYGALSTATDHQNAAIQALKIAGQAQREKGRQTVARAAVDARDAYAQAGAILGLKTPAGADPCTAARQAFDDELRRERGQP